MDKYKIYYYCDNCGFLTFEEFDKGTFAPDKIWYGRTPCEHCGWTDYKLVKRKTVTKGG